MKLISYNLEAINKLINKMKKFLRKFIKWYFLVCHCQGWEDTYLFVWTPYFVMNYFISLAIVSNFDFTVAKRNWPFRDIHIFDHIKVVSVKFKIKND